MAQLVNDDNNRKVEIKSPFAGENGSFQDGVNAYLLEIGLSQADIDKFKQNMLE